MSLTLYFTIFLYVTYFSHYASWYVLSSHIRPICYCICDCPIIADPIFYGISVNVSYFLLVRHDIYGHLIFTLYFIVSVKYKPHFDRLIFHGISVNASYFTPCASWHMLSSHIRPIFYCICDCRSPYISRYIC